MTNPTTRPPAPPLTDDEAARLRAIDEAPAAPESFANQRTTGLRNPITGAVAPVYDPAIHGGDSAWLAVTCTRCGRHFVSTPWDELMTPAPGLGHTGDVCEPCLYALAHRRVAQ